MTKATTSLILISQVLTWLRNFCNMKHTIAAPQDPTSRSIQQFLREFTFLLLPGCRCSERTYSGDRVTSLCPEIPQRLSRQISKGNDSAALIQKKKGTIFFEQHTSFSSVLQATLPCAQLPLLLFIASRKCIKCCYKQCNESEPVPICVYSPLLSNLSHYKPSLKTFLFTHT